VIGDWGVKGSSVQKKVAEQIDIYAKKHNAHFIITAGDNFYPSGVSSTTDAHWSNSYENIYTKEGHQVPWYPVLGNHDYRGNPDAQIKYSTVSSRWKMPARYYSFKQDIDRSTSALFVFTDTSPFVEAYHNYSMADLQKQDTAKQLTWLQETLTPDRQWKIVVGHHPVYSAGSHGNTGELIKKFKPIFLQSKTDFYICGHEHNLQHLKIASEPVQYFISGGGGRSLYGLTRNANSIFARSIHGFMSVTLYRDRANVYFYNENGILLHRAQVEKNQSE
ncbi:MAG TPA: tartrate-resistant acid phosphatase type 5 family protein, partial [Flavisolibacter sp.]|nr:tartrate-resistant acid phosphatase type 5 family protein [Flavisolibacter sp.]